MKSIENIKEELEREIEKLPGIKFQKFYNL